LLFFICPPVQFFSAKSLLRAHPLLRYRYDFSLLFRFFFFANFLFCSQVTLLADVHGRPLPRGPTRPHYRRRQRQRRVAWTGQDMPHLAVSLHPHAPRRRDPRPLHVSLGLRHCMRHVVVPFDAAHIVSRCPHGCTRHVVVPSRLPTSRRGAPRGCTHHVAVPLADACTASPCSLVRFIFYFFLLPSSFAARRQRPRHHTQRDEGNRNTNCATTTAPATSCAARRR
jgi:hypothetical protein